MKKQNFHEFLLRHRRAGTQASPGRSKSMTPKNLKPLGGAKIPALPTKIAAGTQKSLKKCSVWSKGGLGKRLGKRSSSILRAVAVSDRFCTRKNMGSHYFCDVFLRKKTAN